ncbi:phosphate acetyltransferase [Fusobacterium polymorphum]|uniref:phosphate acetyltransferase n=1 Tax=Fusobacterium nucleatum subsp. polymorphum TaxID=76857 RepID=UPI001C6EF909|nr:phosphate acetyltransferase [Fusobacterium polymorphum]QYR62125.1 phosphate acetyltransferase [Fusobacterium polymorphum]
MSFLGQVRKKALQANRRIVLPESSDERVIRAASQILKENLAQVILVGNQEAIMHSAKAYEVSLSGVKIVDPYNFERLNDYVNKLVELRSKKGMTPEEAKKILQTDPNFFGAMLVKMGDADGMVSGSASPTANVLRAAIQVIGTQPGVKTVSSVFIMELSQFKDLFGSILVFGDCSVIPVPTSEQLADIATSAAETAVRIAGINPRVALLTFSTKGSAKHECVDRIIEAGRILRERKVQFRFDDELQADAALVKSVGEIKAPLSDVSGNANVLIFPTLSAGNIGYKLVQRLAGANAYGPIIQGLNAPVNDLSRGCSVEDIVVLTAITSAQACIDC